VSCSPWDGHGSSDAACWPSGLHERMHACAGACDPIDDVAALIQPLPDRTAATATFSLSTSFYRTPRKVWTRWRDIIVLERKGFLFQSL